MRRCDAGGACDDPLYLHGDHLGSVSLTTDSSGAVVSQARYMPYGEVRWESSPSLTDFAFTGQRLDGFGLMDFNARYFSPRLGRFISADSIVPNPGDATSFDRYAFVNNNPLRYIDPTGHGACDGLYKVPECDEIDPDGDGKVPAPDNIDDYFRSKIQSPIRGPGQQDMDGFGQYRGMDYCVPGGECSGERYFHPGIDQGHEFGTSVYAIYPGYVVFAGWTEDLGWTIIIEHSVYGQKYYSVYGHLGRQPNIPDDPIFSGIYVTQGQYVDSSIQVGSLGNSKGPRNADPIYPHLHWEVRKSTNVNLSQENPLRGMQWWIFRDGVTSWYRICSPWQDCWLDLGALYGYDTTYNEEYITNDK